MTTQEFEQVIENRIDTCKSTLCNKAKEYATEDRLHNKKINSKRMYAITDRT